MDEIAERFKRAFATGRFEARDLRDEQQVPSNEIMRRVIGAAADALGMTAAEKAATIFVHETIHGNDMAAAFAELRAKISTSDEPADEPPI